MDAKADLDTATCTVLVDYTKNHYMIDRVSLDMKLTEEATKSLRSLGIRVKAENTRTMIGAGGGELNILGAFMLAKSLIDYISVLIMLIKVPSDLYVRHIKKTSGKNRPAVNLYLRLSSAAELSSKNFYSDLGQRLSVLCRAGGIEIKRLQEKYPIYDFNYKVSLSLPEHGFEASYWMASDKNSAFNQSRLLRVVESLRFKEGLGICIRFTRFGFIEHSLSPQTLILASPHRKKDWRYVVNTRKFYTLTSGRTLMKLARKTRTMFYDDYRSKYLGSAAK